MAHDFLRRAPALAAAGLAVLLSACGGGSAEDSPRPTTTVAAATPDDDTAAALAETAAYRPTMTAQSTRQSARQAAERTATELVIRARGDLAAGTGALMQLRIDGRMVGSVEVRNSTDWQDYRFRLASLVPGTAIDIVFGNDARIAGADRNLYIALVASGATAVLPSAPTVRLDQGTGAQAFDGLQVVPGRSELYGNGALRLRWPAASSLAPDLRLRRQDASRFLLQASFGPTPGTIDQLTRQTFAAWITAQQALPVQDSHVPAVQARYDRGDDHRPGGRHYSPEEVQRTFWKDAHAAPDQLRKRVAYALHQIFMVSQADSSLWHHGRAYARYLDLLNRHAFGNYRTLLEEMALSPAMGIYLSHLRNRKEDPASGRLPDENFARELMQLFSIGLVELRPDGNPVLDARGDPVETYTNADVMAMAKVFTGYGWAFPDNALTEHNFRWGLPDYTRARDTRIDLLPMKVYPGQHSTAEKILFAGKPWALRIPGGTPAHEARRRALDALFRHPNVGPFIGRQLIQKLVTSQPSPAYVARVSAVFANNGRGVRGDLGAVVRAILLDPEARGMPPPGFGKLREPVLRITQWRRAFNATSVDGSYNFAWQATPAGQRLFEAPSVFGDFRPGYVPPNSRFAERGATAPEFQIVNENTVAGWVNLAEAMGSGGLGWSGGQREVQADYGPLVRRLDAGDLAGLLDDIDHLLFGSTMSAELRGLIIDAVSTVTGHDAESQRHRARMAVFVAMASPEFLIQR